MADGERLKPVEGVVLPPMADVVYQGSPFAAAAKMQRVGCGTSLLDMVAAQAIPTCFHPDVQVFIGDHEIDRENWAVVRPKPGAEVFIRVNMRGGGGGKDIMRAVAMIGIMVVAYMVAGPMANLLLGAVSMPAGVALATAGVAHGVLSGAIAAGIMTAGQALVNALIPPPSAKSQWGFDQELGNPYGQITGLRNQAAPYGPIPRVFGKRRMFPMLAGRPYTETIGNDQYLRLLLMVGFGPLKISDIKLGETPISSIQGLEIETREGWENDAAVTLYTKAIQEDNFSIVMDGAGSTATRTTRPNTKEISVEINFPSGVNRVKDNELRFHEVSITVQYRATGTTGAWINADWATKVEAEGTKNAGILFTRDKTQNGLRRSGRWTVPVGQYDVKVTRTSPKEPMGETGYGMWTTLRSIVDTDFLPMKGLSLIAMKIKASGQLNGVPDQINCVAESYLPVYDGVSAWNWQVTRSPAWAYAHLLRYRGYQRIHDDSRIHLGEIKAWADACEVAPPNGTGPYWTFDGVIEGGSIFSNLRTVASHGRAAFHIKDGKYSVVRDTAQTVPVQSFSPRNSWGYAGSKVFSDLPHALRVRFPNEEKQFAEDEVIVYAPGYSKEGGSGTTAASTYETIDMPGCSRPSQAWREGMYHYAVLLLRPETHTIYADVENLRCQMGSFVRFSHDVIKVGLGWGRLTGVVTSGANVTHLVLDGEMEMAPGTTYGIRCRKGDFASVVMALAPVAVGTITRTVQLATPIPLANAPSANDLFQFGVSGLESAPMMVKRISPGADLTAQITLVDAQPGVWTADGGTIPAFNTYITNPIPVERQQPPMPVMRLTSDSSTAKYGNDGTVIERVLVSFDALPSSEVIIDHLDIQYRDVDTPNFTPMPPQPRETASVFIDKVQAEANYEVRSRTVTATGMASDWNTQQVLAKGKTTPPLPPTTLAATAGVGSQVGQISVAWTLSTDADLWGTEIWASADNNRANASLVGRVADPGQTFDHALAGVVNRYYWVRSQDLSGNYSTDNPNAADQWFPASPTGGVLGQTRSILITDLDPNTQAIIGSVSDITDRLLTVEEIAYQNQTAVNDLEAVYGDTVSAAESALAAGEAATLAALKAQEADGSASASNVSAGIASTKADEAGISATAANASKLAAQLAETNAGNSAASSVISASQAQTYRDQSGEFASASSGSATAAATSAGNASTFASQASTSAGNANTAAISSGVSASTAREAANSPLATAPGTAIDSFGVNQWSSLNTTANLRQFMADSGGKIYVENGAVRVANVTDSVHFHTAKAAVRPSGHRFKVAASYRRIVDGGSPSTTLFYWTWDVNGNVLDQVEVLYDIHTVSQGLIRREFDVTVNPNAAWMRTMLRVYSPTGLTEVLSIETIDGEGQIAAAASAAVATTQAASASASAASASISANLAVSVANSRPNILPNSSAWAGLSKWTNEGDGIIGDPNSSDGARFIRFPNSGMAGVATSLRSDNIGMAPNTTLSISAEVFCNCAADPGFQTRAYIAYFNSGGGVIDYLVAQTYGNTAGWVPIKAEGKVSPAGTSFVRVYLDNYYVGMPAFTNGGAVAWRKVKLEEGATASPWNDIGQTGALASQLSVTASVAADVATRMATAAFEVVAASGGDPAQLLVKTTGSTSLVQMVASALRFGNVIGGQIVDVMKLIGGSVYISGKLLMGATGQIELDPAYPLILWKFGTARLAIGQLPSNNLFLWFGGNETVPNMRKNNAKVWFDTTGGSYWGGSILSGTISNSVQGSLTTAPVSATLGPFSTNGGPITVNWSYNLQNVQSRYGDRRSTVAGTVTSLVRLYRKIGTGAETLVDSMTVNGTYSLIYDAEVIPGQPAGTVGNTLLTNFAGGSSTFSDNVGGTGARTYRVEVVSRSYASITGTTYQTEFTDQRYGATSSE